MMQSSDRPSLARRYFADDDFDFAARTALGHAAQGAGDIGPLLAMFERIENGNAQSWYEAWHEMADSARSDATLAVAQRHAATAAAFFLTASEAYDQALAFIDGLPDDSLLLPTFKRHRECWDAFIDASEGKFQRVAVPYEGDVLPGYLFRPDASGAPRPTVVVSNGSDGALTGLWSTVIRATLERGWNAFVFDGPGQQSMLFERGIFFRHDWEAVLTPVIDCLVARTDVDEKALLAYGISQAGYWLPRALAYEHRFIAAVVDSGVMDVSRTWFSQLPPELIEIFRSGDAPTFDKYMNMSDADPRLARTFAFRARPYGKKSAFELFTAVSKYSLEGITHRITTPLMTTDADGEEFFPGQAQELFDALKGDKLLVKFTRAAGADSHCEPLARRLVSLRMNDFFADRLLQS